MEITFKDDEVEAVIEKKIQNGQIFGLTKFNGRTVKIVILKIEDQEDEPKEAPKKVNIEENVESEKEEDDDDSLDF